MVYSLKYFSFSYDGILAGAYPHGFFFLWSLMQPREDCGFTARDSSRCWPSIFWSGLVGSIYENSEP